jgi:hypothetical protein
MGLRQPSASVVAILVGIIVAMVEAMKGVARPQGSAHSAFAEPVGTGVAPAAQGSPRAFVRSRDPDDPGFDSPPPPCSDEACGISARLFSRLPIPVLRFP